MAMAMDQKYKTDITIESPEGEKKVWDIEIKKNTYDIEERKDQD